MNVCRVYVLNKSACTQLLRNGMRLNESSLCFPSNNQKHNIAMNPTSTRFPNRILWVQTEMKGNVHLTDPGKQVLIEFRRTSKNIRREFSNISNFLPKTFRRDWRKSVVETFSEVCTEECKLPLFVLARYINPSSCATILYLRSEPKPFPTRWEKQR